MSIEYLKKKVNAMAVDCLAPMSPGHHQLWYWLCRIHWFLSSMTNVVSYMCHLSFEKSVALYDRANKPLMVDYEWLWLLHYTYVCIQSYFGFDYHWFVFVTRYSFIACLLDIYCNISSVSHVKMFLFYQYSTESFLLKLTKILFSNTF